VDRENVKRDFRKKTRLSIFLLAALLIIFSMIAATRSYAEDQSEKSVESAGSNSITSAEQANVAKFGLIAAAIAFGFGAIGAGIAIANVGAAAMGAIAEKPEIAGQALIFIALAEGLVVFGFITALMILGKI
jgi:V/A-type H+-transporting ATPase subunit K